MIKLDILSEKRTEFMIFFFFGPSIALNSVLLFACGSVPKGIRQNGRVRVPGVHIWSGPCSQKGVLKIIHLLHLSPILKNQINCIQEQRQNIFLVSVVVVIFLMHKVP